MGRNVSDSLSRPLAGAPLLVVARALGHATTRMTEMRYAHLSLNFEASEIKRAAPRFGIASDVVSAVQKGPSQ